MRRKPGKLFITRILTYYALEFSTGFAMRYFHLVFGILVFIAFMTTGRFMRSDFPDKDAIEQEFRLLMRSRHIYILFSALIHLGLGIYLQIRPAVWQRAIQITGSAVLVISSLLLISAFVVETYSLHGFSDISRFGIYTSLLGVGLHLFGGLCPRKVD